MRIHRASAGPFREKPFYKNEEFETITSSELSATGLMPATPEPIRIERFIEKRFGITPEYEDLGVLGAKVMGVTVFGERGVARIIISSSLDDGTVVGSRRARTTLAHEVGHGLLHAHLFVLGLGEAPLFGDVTDPKQPRIMCREGQIEDGTGPKRPYEWYEFQANRAMSSILLPRKLVTAAAVRFLEPFGLLGGLTLPVRKREDAARALAEVFDVNPAVVRIRLGQLYPENGQGAL